MAQQLKFSWNVNIGRGPYRKVLPQVSEQKGPHPTRGYGCAKPAVYAPWVAKQRGESTLYPLWEGLKEYITYDFQKKPHCRAWNSAVLWLCWPGESLAPNERGPHGNGKWLRKTTAEEERVPSLIIYPHLDIMKKKQTFIENLPFTRFSALEDIWTNYHTPRSAQREISTAGKGQTPPGESEKTQRGGNTESVKGVNIRDMPTHILFPSIQSNASRSRDVSSFTLNRGKDEKGQVKTFRLNMGIQSLQEDNPSC